MRRRVYCVELGVGRQQPCSGSCAVLPGCWCTAGVALPVDDKPHHDPTAAAAIAATTAAAAAAAARWRLTKIVLSVLDRQHT
mgnify:CR=1 FL=1